MNSCSQTIPAGSPKSDLNTHAAMGGKLRTTPRLLSLGGRSVAYVPDPRTCTMYEELVVTRAWWDYVDVIASPRASPRGFAFAPTAFW